jgi:hypothetical protein
LLHASAAVPASLLLAMLSGEAAGMISAVYQLSLHRCVPPFRVQFLPQDKVVEFARMSPVDLLAATEKVRLGYMSAPQSVSYCQPSSLQAAAALGNGVNVAAMLQLTSSLVCSI